MKPPGTAIPNQGQRFYHPPPSDIWQHLETFQWSRWRVWVRVQPGDGVSITARQHPPPRLGPRVTCASASCLGPASLRPPGFLLLWCRGPRAPGFRPPAERTADGALRTRAEGSAGRRRGPLCGSSPSERPARWAAPGTQRERRSPRQGGRRRGHRCPPEAASFSATPRPLLGSVVEGRVEVSGVRRGGGVLGDGRRLQRPEVGGWLPATGRAWGGRWRLSLGAALSDRGTGGLRAGAGLVLRFGNVTGCTGRACEQTHATVGSGSVLVRRDWSWEEGQRAGPRAPGGWVSDDRLGGFLWDWPLP